MTIASELIKSNTYHQYFFTQYTQHCTYGARCEHDDIIDENNYNMINFDINVLFCNHFGLQDECKKFLDENANFGEILKQNCFENYPERCATFDKFVENNATLHQFISAHVDLLHKNGDLDLNEKIGDLLQ